MAALPVLLGFVLVAGCSEPEKKREVKVRSASVENGPSSIVDVSGPEPARTRMERVGLAALPVLERSIGSRWPRPSPVSIRIVASRAEAEGELGFFDVAKNEIRVVKEIPSWLLAHELAHGWYGAPFSHDRRQNEGRATAAALRVLHARPDLGDEEWVRASLLHTAGSVPQRELKEPPSPLPANWSAEDERRKNAFYALAWFEAEKTVELRNVEPEQLVHERAHHSATGTGEIASVEAACDGKTLTLSVTTKSGFERKDTFWNFEVHAGDQTFVAGLGREVDPWIGDTTGLTEPALVEWRPLHRSRLKIEGTRATLTFPRAILGEGHGRLVVHGYIVRGEKRLETSPGAAID